MSVLSTLVLQVKVEQMALELRLTPLTVLLRSVLDQLQEKDPARIFAQPVSLKEVGVLPCPLCPVHTACRGRSPASRVLPLRVLRPTAHSSLSGLGDEGGTLLLSKSLSRWGLPAGALVSVRS